MSDDPTIPAAVQRPLRAAGMPSLVADELRRQILSGELGDGARLPKEEVLRGQFGVGRPAMREAMRILESEGLVTVLRGNQGGAVVRVPQAEQAAYSLGLVLASRGIRTRDVGAALRELEPACAALCAERADRETAVLPTLRAAQADAERVIDDPAAVTAALRTFHEAIVGVCGNETMIVLVGALEELWSSHVTSSSVRAPRARSPEELRRSLDDHELILDRIAAGDADGARRAVLAHIGRVQSSPTPANSNDTPIDIGTLRESLRR